MARIEKKIYYYLYKTKNILNGKEYIGIHKTSNLRDGYIGCGIKTQSSAKRRSKETKSSFVHAVNKYGYDYFIKEVIEYFDSYEEALKREKEIVDIEYVKNKNTYNISVGGRGYDIRTHKKYKLKNYNGNIFEGENIKEFCRKNNLDYSSILRLVNGDLVNSQGFYRYDYKEKIKEFVIVDLIKGECYFTDNLQQWCYKNAPDLIIHSRNNKLSQNVHKPTQIVDKRWWACHGDKWNGYIDIDLNKSSNCVIYTIENEKGEKHIFDNIRKYCRDNNINISTMYGILNRGRNSSKIKLIDKQYIFKNTTNDGKRIYIV